MINGEIVRRCTERKDGCCFGPLGLRGLPVRLRLGGPLRLVHLHLGGTVSKSEVKKVFKDKKPTIQFPLVMLPGTNVALGHV